MTGNDLHYTDYLFANREKWAKTFNLDSFDAGVNTTQRIEGYNSWIKSIKKNSFISTYAKHGYMKSVGLPCRHLINFSLRIQLQELLNDFMLERWLDKSSPNEICPHIQPSPYVIESIPEVIPVSSTLSEKEKFNHIMSLFKAVGSRYAVSHFKELKDGARLCFIQKVWM